MQSSGGVAFSGRAIPRWARLFASTDPQFSRPPSISSPVSLPLRPATTVLFGSGAGYLLSLPSLYIPSARPESLVQQLGAGAPRESLVSGCALPLTASHRKPIETSRISPFGWTFAISLSLTWVTSTLPSSFCFPFRWVSVDCLDSKSSRGYCEFYIIKTIYLTAIRRWFYHYTGLFLLLNDRYTREIKQCDCHLLVQGKFCVTIWIVSCTKPRNISLKITVDKKFYPKNYKLISNNKQIIKKFLYIIYKNTY